MTTSGMTQPSFCKSLQRFILQEAHASSNKSPHQRVIDTENGKEVHSNNPVLHMMVSYTVDFCHLKERSDEKSL